MEHLPRFHRRKKDVAHPTLITSDLSGKTTRPSGDLRPASPMRPFQKLSPFRVFHRSSGKRARDSPPASLPHSPAAAPTPTGDGADGRPVSPISLRTDVAGEEGEKAARPPKMPAFLKQTEEEIMNKFSELVWRERHRIMQSITNPSPDFRWARVTGPHLKTLDRYMNVQPWHNNRIKLQVPEGHVDYINASPIMLTPSPCPTPDGRSSVTREPDRYIAMQGPKQASVDHVWRMVVEQLESPGVIVMLTETHEGHMEKCYPYFPRSPEDPPVEVNERDEFGDGFRASVRCEGIEETPAGDAIELRKLVIRVHSRPNPEMTIQTAPGPARTPDPTEANEKDEDSGIMMNSHAPELTLNQSESADLDPTTKNDNNDRGKDQDASKQPNTSEPEERIVWHFLYKKWPDFGVPTMTDLDSFFALMRLSREKNAGPGNPRIVHCSAGVGRSGTFIALEHLIRELDAGVLENWDERTGPAGTATPLSSAASSSPSLSPPPADTDAGEIDADVAQDQRSSRSQSQSPVQREEQPGQGRDLIFETVNQLREQRRTMVQAESQYLFLYQVMRKLWQDRYGYEVDDSVNAGEPAAKRLEVDPFVE
ncbi:hypothetical protein VTK56DRAFT_1416 [Thermocarpiscus australiensis]